MALVDNFEETPSELDIEETKQQQQQTVDTNEAAETPQQDDTPKVPSKYQGKTLEEIVQMHQEAEKLIGRQAQEVGEVRKLADQLIKNNLEHQNTQLPHQQNKQTEEVDFFEDPQKAIQRAVENHPDVQAAKQTAAQFKAMQTQQQLAAKHPDFAEVVRDGEFQEWIKASPVRLNMFAVADSTYDFNTADELLSTFKQIKGAKAQQTQNAGQQVLQKNLKAASVDVGGTGESSQKVYRRADIMNLMMTNPDRYEALQPEIMEAYRTGRVR
jgi:hypothetical protein